MTLYLYYRSRFKAVEVSVRMGGKERRGNEGRRGGE